MKLERDIELLYEIGTIRHITRTWHQFGGVNFANLAEHTLRVAWIAFILAKYEQVDCDKAMKLAFIHDLPETRTSDVNYLTRMYVERHENDAIDDILVGTSIAEEITDLWREYQLQESLEAKIVKDADNLDCDLELIEQASNGVGLLETFKITRERISSRFHTQTGIQFYQALLSSDPHSWHLHTKNRLTKGDWKG